MSPAPLRLTVSDLACERGGRAVFAGVSFAAGAGDLVAVVGHNGAGKSSLLRVIAGLVPKAAGSVVVEGAETSGDEGRPSGEHMHYCGHADALKPALTVRENLAFWRDYYGGAALAPEDALDLFAIEPLADLPAAYLSAGQKRRLALCRLFVSYRPVWLLDEPTSALDVATQARLSERMREHLAGGGIILAATHGDLGLAPALVLTIGAA
ncbi:heme ABC exporter ATP-binding protein CcmA [Labrys monachus]|uniref:Heme exporter protein A n=1 Tax=Labrys monachus TaxID=217067 RepID=A0ABU0FQ64_9HYPH|nr:heme ABC exporter ATP-binding protein CcmA [Labrys monachus]MDQ0396195.1 heme exporter protein A [Labrys monachus]